MKTQRYFQLIKHTVGSLAVVFGIATALSGCSLTKMTVDQTAQVLQVGSQALNGENDVELAAAALPGSLKTMETFLAAHPEQPILLRLLAEGYTSYAFGFIEDEMEQLIEDHPDRAEVLSGRALNLHLRARGFAMRLLAQSAPELVAALRAGESPTPELLATVDEEGAPALFWVGNAWGAAINVGKSDPSLVAQLETAKFLLARAAELSPSYFFGGPHMALGAIEASIPKALGGRDDLAREHFDKAIELSGGKNLMARLLYARTVGLQTGDREFFVKGLTEVLEADPDAEPSLRLANRLAQRRARRYLALVDELFL